MSGDDLAGPPRITYSDVLITHSKPGTRAYGAAGEQAEREEREGADREKAIRDSAHAT